MKKLRKGDPVIVIAGKNKGKISVIENIDGDNIYLTGVNEAKRATKGKGFIKKILPIHISNIMYYLEGEKKAVKLKIEINSDGKKVRKTKKTNTLIK